MKAWGLPDGNGLFYRLGKNGSFQRMHTGSLGSSQGQCPFCGKVLSRGGQTFLQGRFHPPYPGFFPLFIPVTVLPALPLDVQMTSLILPFSVLVAFGFYLPLWGLAPQSVVQAKQAVLSLIAPYLLS